MQIIQAEPRVLFDVQWSVQVTVCLSNTMPNHYSNTSQGNLVYAIQSSPL